MSKNSDSDSDYCVEEFVTPDRIAKRPVNDDSADLLGNFDDAKRKEIEDGTFKENGSNDGDNHSDNNSVNDDIDGINDKEEDNDDEDDDKKPKEFNSKLSKEQMNILLRGGKKQNRYVLYVTNMNLETTREQLVSYFEQLAGPVKSVRIPKYRRGGFAFVEMTNIDDFQKAFELHNTELNGRRIKIQISEGGKKKSANKKNILKQKNRKLAEMRNESKEFCRSGKNYDKNIKKDKEKEMALRKRWRKPQPKNIK